MVQLADVEHGGEFHKKYAEQVVLSLGSLNLSYIDDSPVFDLALMELVLIEKSLIVEGL
jgi:hypothetical protein